MTASHFPLLHQAARAAVAAAVLTLAATASAGNPTDEATAAALFQEAKALSGAGDYEHACPKLQEAQRLYPTPGTLLTLGDCLEHQGKLASAWGSFKEAELTARNRNDTDREGEAQRRAALLAPKLAKLSIIVPPAARVTGFELRRDGVVVGEGQSGSSLPIDTGWHKIEATAPGHKPWSTSVRIEVNGSIATIEVPVLELAPSEGARDGRPFWSGQRIGGAAVGGVGVIGLVVGAVLGAQAISKNGESKNNCSPTDPNFCNDTGAAVRADAQKFATASTVAMIAGGVALAGGIVLFASAPSAKKSEGARVEIAPRIGGFALQGRF